MAEQKKQGTPTERQGQTQGEPGSIDETTNPGRTGEGQRGTQREQGGIEREGTGTGTGGTTGTDTTTETRNKPEGDVEGLDETKRR